MTEVTKERVEEPREYVRTGRLLVTGDPADVSALINSLDEHSALKAENERLREENGVFDSELGRLRMENEKWCAEAPRQQARAEKAEAANKMLGKTAVEALAENERLTRDLNDAYAVVKMLERDITSERQKKAKAEAELERERVARGKCLEGFAKQEAELAKQAPLIEAAEELSYVAGLRGDDELPHPSNDSKMWTARMQTAWDNLRDALALREKKK